MENKFTPELIEKAKSAKTPEELMALAKERKLLRNSWLLQKKTAQS